jgi:hypothetical protein
MTGIPPRPDPQEVAHGSLSVTLARLITAVPRRPGKSAPVRRVSPEGGRRSKSADTRGDVPRSTSRSLQKG